MNLVQRIQQYCENTNLKTNRYDELFKYIRYIHAEYIEEMCKTTGINDTEILKRAQEKYLKEMVK